ncbi:hypothetical protein [Burkholderia cepacia]|uniref:hypothetical protein n=1 Tax=Burkholderia cepacia TaxID=292 RepID=UPI0012955F5D|nr:hypothetical protein [Burkholderia cepacia]
MNHVDRQRDTQFDCCDCRDCGDRDRPNDDHVQGERAGIPTYETVMGISHRTFIHHSSASSGRGYIAGFRFPQWRDPHFPSCQ